MDYTNYLTKTVREKLEDNYQPVSDIEQLNTEQEYAIYMPWSKTVEFNIQILKIDDGTLYLEQLVNNQYERTYKKHINLDFKTVTVFVKSASGHKPPNIKKYANTRFLEYFKRKQLKRKST